MGAFGPHYDGCYVKDAVNRSMKTFMVYLNDDFEGGSTNFIDEKQELWKDPVLGIWRAQEENILFRLQPKTGMAIVFNHQILHEGGMLKSGKKYIFRSEIMFEQIHSDHITSEKETKALALLQEAEHLESDGFAMEAAEKYRMAFKLFPPLADTYKS